MGGHLLATRGVTTALSVPPSASPCRPPSPDSSAKPSGPRPWWPVRWPVWPQPGAVGPGAPRPRLPPWQAGGRPAPEGALHKGLHQPPALPAPGLPLPRLVKPAQRHPRPGRALGPGCHQRPRLPQCSTAPQTASPGGPWPGDAGRRACVPHSRSSMQLCEDGLASPRTLGVCLHNRSVPTRFPSDTPEAEDQISEPTGR